MAANSLRAVPRRAVLRMLGGGAAAALAAGALGACTATRAASGGGPSAPRTAAPQQAAGHTITLLWRPWYNFNEGTSKLGLQLLYDAATARAINHWTGLAQAGKVPVAQALPQAAAQVDALQLAAAAQSGVAAQALRRFPVRGRSIARVTPGL